MIKLVLIDDHDLLREGIASMLQNTRDIQIVGEAATGKEGISKVRDVRPDVVLLDVKLPDITGLEVTRRLVKMDPNVIILVVSTLTNSLYPFRLMEEGAKGYLTKTCNKAELEQAIRKVRAGQRYLGTDIAKHLALAKLASQQVSAFDGLTNKEMEVALLVVQGKEVKDIAQLLFIAPKTVHTYRRRILKKLQIKNDVELTLLAIQSGVVGLEFL